MPKDRPQSGKSGAEQLIADVRAHQKKQETTYRARALKMYPHICGRCGREFSGKRLRELTVHHKNHDHDYNPPDGSNWELLCLYCHDNEHERNKVADALVTDSAASGEIPKPELSHQPFGNLADLLKSKK